MRRFLGYAVVGVVAFVAGGALVGATGFAQMGHHGHHGQHGHGQGAGGPVVEAFMAANARMHEAMDIVFTGDADVDFARGMIPHHQGAIEMSEVVLEHGSDPEIRQLAEEIIAAQEEEIAFLREWLERHGH
ncbi:MAG: DUF305 domain-containing protein [Geminicoccaceae bacterium]|nr:MAG: DUF305 domain-containing protein [Geminicoccaceae bacterium]